MISTFAHLVGDVRVVDAWPDASAPAWRTVVNPMRFHAAHRLEGLPEDHKRRNQHGHGYQVGAEIDPTATASIVEALRPAEAFVRRELHQRSLNEVLGQNPTAEQLAETLGAHFTGELQIPGWWACSLPRRPRRWRCGGHRSIGHDHDRDRHSSEEAWLAYGGDGLGAVLRAQGRP